MNCPDDSKLLEYVSRSGRVCPNPQLWNDLFKLLCKKAAEVGVSKPPVPLILAGWNFSDDSQKRACLQSQIKWAIGNGAFELIDRFIRAMPDDQWHVGSTHKGSDRLNG